MSLEEINICPSTLAVGYTTYSPVALRYLFNGKKVNHVLDFDAPQTNEIVAEKFRLNTTSISISGAQFKQSLVLDKKKLRLTKPGEPGQYILKPIPLRPPFGNEDQLPANEHLTMQIAKQAFGINTAECALVFFKNGEPAYLTKRFDYASDGNKIAQEDFASLMMRSKEREADTYRTSGSYEDIATTMKKYLPAYAVEIEKYFERVVFNYLFSNGDAHLKNFSVQQTVNGDYLLTPAYDLINTRIHLPNDSFFALRDGLFRDYETESIKALGFYAYDDFYEFGRRINMIESRLKKILEKYRTENAKVRTLISISFLDDESKSNYEKYYLDRLKMLNNSYSKKI
jgi:serine/threonine-protein kinase HipA